jgi:N-acetyl-anhydromuramyl-L-alanine amidase AmpD
MLNHRECGCGEAAEDEDTAESGSLKQHIILLSGGPGPFDTRDVEHDASWANYVTAPLLLTSTSAGRKAFQSDEEDVWWFIYRPAYEARWTDDVASSHAMRKKAVKEVRDKGFDSYVDMLEARAKDRKWQLRWLTAASELWTKLATFRKRSISRFHYWGHARDDLWLTITHASGSGTASSPDASAIVKSGDIDAALKNRFAKSSAARLHRFVGCNTDDFAAAWAKAYSVWTEGVEQKVNFVSLSRTGGEPCLVGSARAIIYAPGGTEDAGQTSALAGCTTSAGEVAEAVADEAWGELVAEPASAGERLVNAAELLAHGAPAGIGRRGDLGILTRGLLPSLGPAELFERLLSASADLGLRVRIEVLGRPGGRLTRPLEMGDILLRHFPGERALSHLAVLASGQALARSDAHATGWELERAGDGLYAQTIDTGILPHCAHSRFARRVSDPGGRIPPGQLVLRVLETPPPPAPDGGDLRDAVEALLLEAGAPVAVQLRNRLRAGEGVAGCTLELVGTAVSVAGDAHGSAHLDLTGVPDGDYLLRVTPAEHSADPVGPALAAATPRPGRIWRALETTVAVRAERITATSHADTSVIGAALRVKLQPVWIKSPNASARALDISHVVIHHTAGPRIGPAIETFLGPGNASAHYMIDVDGQIVKLVHESMQSWHAGASHWGGRDNVNRFSVGIEVVHSAGAFPQAQYDALIALLGRLRAAYPDLSVSRFISHSDIGTCPAPTSCQHVAVRRLGRKSGDPGLDFEWSQLEVAGYGLSMPAGPMNPAAYGGFFALVPAGRLRSGDRDSTHRYGGAVRPTITANVIAELQGNLRCIGYWCPDTGQYDDPTHWAVAMFQERYFSGARTPAAHSGQVDLITAMGIKGIVSEAPECLAAAAPASAPAAEDSPGRTVRPRTACRAESDALALELAAARATLARSTAISDLLLGTDSTYWFAQLYVFITEEELRAAQRGDFEFPAFLLHFIPIFYEMYAVNAERHARRQRDQIDPTWRGHFILGEPHADGQRQPTLYMAQANTSIISGVSAHISGDMGKALERAYREYTATYCVSRPFDAYREDFFERNRAVFAASRSSLINHLINLGMGFGSMGRTFNPGFAGQVADSVGAGLNIEQIYAMRAEAWRQAKQALGQ